MDYFVQYLSRQLAIPILNRSGLGMATAPVASLIVESVEEAAAN